MTDSVGITLKRFAWRLQAARLFGQLAQCIGCGGWSVALKAQRCNACLRAYVQQCSGDDDARVCAAIAGALEGR